MNEHSSTQSGMFRLICERTPQMGSQEGAEAHPVVQVGTATPQDGIPQGLTMHEGDPQDGLLQEGAPHGSIGVPQPPTSAVGDAGTTAGVAEAAQEGQGPEGSYPTGYAEGAVGAIGVGATLLATGCQ